MHPENHLTHNWLIKKFVNDKVRSHLKNLNGTVIDLGCGTRPYEADIAKHVDKYIGVDWNNTLHGLYADVIADLNKPLPFGDGSIDCIVTFEVIEHLAEPGLMLQEACRILRSGSTLLLSAPFQWWLHEAPWDYQRFTRYGLEYQFRKAGFEIVSIEETSGFWSMWILKLNYQLIRLIRGPRWLRTIIRFCLIPFWWMGQIIAPLLDSVWKEDKETAGYFVMAKKP
ncbi:MAG: class I SAM-dependent methyltransferase [Candidatus Saccharimonadales bacterium]